MALGNGAGEREETRIIFLDEEAMGRSPGRVAQMVGVSSCTPKGRAHNFSSGFDP